VPNEWLRQRKRDQFHRLAKKRGFRSRASFKLIQVTKKYRFIKRGDHVLDLGAAPGGWLQAVHQIVGNRGLILGVDTETVKPLPFPNVSTIIRDITQDGTVEEIQSAAGPSFDVVISDLSPNVSGVWEVDHARQIELARVTLRISRLVLKPRGNLLVKVFQGSELRDFQTEMKSCFDFFRIVKPPASRAESAELYLLGLGFIG
jgi:23S rRNA (uridine2552-2'-O)-methyltransferase